MVDSNRLNEGQIHLLADPMLEVFSAWLGPSIMKLDNVGMACKPSQRLASADVTLAEKNYIVPRELSANLFDWVQNVFLYYN